MIKSLTLRKQAKMGKEVIFDGTNYEEFEIATKSYLRGKGLGKFIADDADTKAPK